MKIFDKIFRRSRGCGKDNLEEVAAIIDIYVARKGEPIVRAIRTSPVDPQDSGWQFLGRSPSVDSIEYTEIWTLREIVNKDPTISDILNCPYGTHLTRTDVNSAWKS